MFVKVILALLSLNSESVDKMENFHKKIIRAKIAHKKASNKYSLLNSALTTRKSTDEKSQLPEIWQSPFEDISDPLIMTPSAYFKDVTDVHAFCRLLAIANQAHTLCNRKIRKLVGEFKEMFDKIPKTSGLSYYSEEFSDQLQRIGSLQRHRAECNAQALSIAKFLMRYISPKHDMQYFVEFPERNLNNIPYAELIFPDHINVKFLIFSSLLGNDMKCLQESYEVDHEYNDELEIRFIELLEIMEEIVSIILAKQ